MMEAVVELAGQNRNHSWQPNHKRRHLDSRQVRFHNLRLMLIQNDNIGSIFDKLDGHKNRPFYPDKSLDLPLLVLLTRLLLVLLLSVLLLSSLA